jgi:ketosteroid isomerase-like protein
VPGFAPRPTSIARFTLLTVSDEIDALRRIYDAFSRWDVDELALSVAHDFEVVMPDTLPWGGTFHGADGVQAFATVFRDYVEGQWADPDEYMDAGDSIVVLGRLRGRGIATGLEFEVGFAHAWTLSDGVPARCRAYFDTAPIMAAIEDPTDAAP